MIHIEAWHLWIVLCLALFVAEVFHPVFIFAALGMAAAISALFAVFVDARIQLLIFAASALAIFFTLRPAVLKHLYSSKDIKTNVQAMIGKTGVVVDEIGPGLKTGSVKVGGEVWIGISSAKERIGRNETVSIVDVEGTKLYVKKGDG